MAKIKVKQLEALRPANASTKIRDDGGLVGTIRTRADGVSVKFDWRYRFGGKVKDYACGTWPKDSLADIRAVRDKARQTLDGGKDPSKEKRIERLKSHADQAEAAMHEEARITGAEARNARQTISELFANWERRELSRRKDKGAEVYRSFKKDVFPTLGAVAVEDVRRAMIVKVLDGVVERGAPIVARNLLGDLRQMFGYAIMREIIENDPTSILKRDDFGKKIERERVLSEAEIKMLDDKLIDARLTTSSVMAIWIMLSTCCRVGEISRARWEHFDAGTWRIPADNAKNAKEHHIYLTPFAIQHFQTLKELAGESHWVLPARWESKSNVGHVSLKNLAKQIGDRQRGDKMPMAGRSLHTNALTLPGGKWTPHDLRRTGATMMGALGVRPDVIEKCLNHVEQNKLIRIYQRQELKAEQAEAWRLLGERLELLLRDDADNVITLNTKAA